eukprot:5208594-Lingulodinium_polyedra.AAC.1
MPTPADCSHSAEFAAQHGRAAKLATGLERALGFLLQLFPPSAYRPSEEDLARLVEDKRKRANVAKLALDSSGHLWGMAADRWYVGFDLLGLATMRVTTHGFRKIIALKLKSAVANDGAALGITEKSTLEQIRELIVQAPKEKWEEAGAGGFTDLRFVTAGPGDFLLAPPGWLLCEQTSGKAAFGLRKVILLPGVAADHAASLMDSRRSNGPSAVVAAIRELLAAAARDNGEVAEAGEQAAVQAAAPEAACGPAPEEVVAEGGAEVGSP